MIVQSRVRLRVSPGARQSAVVGRYGDGWKVQVAAPPENGRANDAVVSLLAQSTGVPTSSIAVVAGKSARDKTVVLQGLADRDVDRKLEAASRA